MIGRKYYIAASIGVPLLVATGVFIFWLKEIEPLYRSGPLAMRLDQKGISFYGLEAEEPRFSPFFRLCGIEIPRPLACLAVIAEDSIESLDEEDLHAISRLPALSGVVFVQVRFPSAEMNLFLKSRDWCGLEFALTNLDDDMLGDMPSMPRLLTLSIVDCPVSDRMFAELLEKCPNLEYIEHRVTSRTDSNAQTR